MESAKVEVERNILKRGLNWIDRENTFLYSATSEKQRTKIKHLVNKKSGENHKPPQTLQGVKKAWLEEVACGYGRKKNPV